VGRLYNRQMSITVVKPTSFLGQSTNAIIIRDCAVQFHAEKHLHGKHHHRGQTPNRCEISIFNLNDHDRAAFEEKPLYIRLDAGYDGEEERVFEGDLTFSESIQDGPDWETRLEVGDGHRALKFGRVNRSFAGTTPYRTAIREVIKALDASVTSAVLSKVPNEFFQGGVVIEGLAQHELTRLLRPFELTWSIQNGQLQILAKGESLRTQAALIDQSKGMIGSPTFGSPPAKKKPRPLTVKNLLYPSLLPGGLVQVSSRFVNGLFSMERVLHVGDTHGEPWDTTIEALPKANP
jgi:hypothetical protein